MPARDSVAVRRPSAVVDLTSVLVAMSKVELADNGLKSQRLSTWVARYSLRFRSYVIGGSGVPAFLTPGLFHWGMRVSLQLYVAVAQPDNSSEPLYITLERSPV